MSVFEKKARSRIFGPNTDEMTESGQNCIMSSTMSTNNIIKSRKKNETDEVCLATREIRNTHIIFAGKSKGERLFGRPESRQQDTIKMGKIAIGHEGQVPVGGGDIVSTVMNLQIT